MHVQQTRKNISLSKNKIQLKSPRHYTDTEYKGHVLPGQDEDYEKVGKWHSSHT